MLLVHHGLCQEVIYVVQYGIVEKVMGLGGQEIKKVLGRNIKQLRANMRFSQALLAEKADISTAYLSKIERGVKFPKPDIISQIADSLGVEVYELFRTDQQPKPAPVVVSDEKVQLINRLSKIMSKKINKAVNNTMEQVFRDFMK